MPFQGLGSIARPAFHSVPIGQAFFHVDGHFVEQPLQAADCDVYSERRFLLGLLFAGLSGCCRVSEELGLVGFDLLLSLCCFSVCLRSLLLSLSNCLSTAFL